MFFACVVVGAWQKSDRVAVIARDGVLRGDPAARARAEQRLRWLLEAYHAETGAYPPTLEALSENGVARGNVTQRAAVYHFEYRLTRDGSAYTLL